MAAPRLNLVISDDLQVALKDRHKKTKVPISTFARDAIVKALRDEGYDIEDELAWGGQREKASDEGEE